MEERREMRVLIQRYSTTELAPFFRRSPRAFRRELAKVKHRYGPRVGQKWSIEQVRKMIDDFGGAYHLVIIEPDHQEAA